MFYVFFFFDIILQAHGHVFYDNEISLSVSMVDLPTDRHMHIEKGITSTTDAG